MPGETSLLRRSAPAATSAIALYARALPDFDAKVAAAVERLRRASLEFGDRIVQVSSLGAEGMVVTDLIARHQLPIPVGTLDTGKLHAQTLALIPRIRSRYGITVEVARPRAEQVVHFVRSQGERAMYRSVELRKLCCGIRKLEPLARLLEGRDAWITGMRREQSETRQAVGFSERDEDGRVKINALADWTWADVWHYIALHEVPYNPLHDAFMPSIGCAPCTRAIAVGEDFRAGRWWWEEESEKECGLHVAGAGQIVSLMSRAGPELATAETSAYGSE